MIKEGLKHLSVPIDSVKTFPGNARRGDTALIASSLRHHGQFRPIVVDQRFRILAGNHTWRAAKDLGWSEIAAVFVEVSDKEAKRIVLADNRTGDRGWDDENLLSEQLQGLTDLSGTGYDEVNLDRLLGRVNTGLDGLEDGPEGGGRKGTPGFAPPRGIIKLGIRVISVDIGSFTMWAEALIALHGMIGAHDEIRRLLELPGAPPRAAPRRRPKGGVVRPELARQAEMVDIDSLRPWPDSARRGDEEAICESLAVNGQFRPLVVATDGTVIIGSAVLSAARRLGWTKMSVVRVEADDEQAAKMRLVDNRTAAVASYDDVDLASLLEEFSDDPFGTGFEPEDVETLLARVDEPANPDKIVLVRAKCPAAGVDWKIAVPQADFDKWDGDLIQQAGFDEELYARLVLRRLDLDCVPLTSS